MHIVCIASTITNGVFLINKFTDFRQFLFNLTHFANKNDYNEMKNTCNLFWPWQCYLITVEVRQMRKMLHTSLKILTVAKRILTITTCWKSFLTCLKWCYTITFTSNVYLHINPKIKNSHLFCKNFIHKNNNSSFNGIRRELVIFILLHM